MIVYIYTFPNGKKYIGQTVQTLTHRARKGEGYKNCPLVYNAIQKYGWDNIQKETIECSSMEEMDNIEIELIKKYNTTNAEFGYNIDNGGNKNKILSEEHKRKISESQKGEKSYWYGKHHTEETKQKISETLRGRHPSEEARKHMSEAQKGRKHTEETKMKMRIARGTPVICLETKEVFQSTGIAAEAVGLKSSRDISRVCRGDRKTSAGYHWMWLEDYQKQNG